MSRFKLKERTLKIRDTEVLVRELTHAERVEFNKRAAAGDKAEAPAILASMGIVEPKMTPEEIADEPFEVVHEICGAIMDLSGMRKATAEKEPDAR